MCVGTVCTLLVLCCCRVKVHAVDIIKLLEADTLYGATATGMLHRHSSSWDKYRHQKHDLFLSRNDTRDYFLTDVSNQPSRLLKNTAAASESAPPPSHPGAVPAPPRGGMPFLPFLSSCVCCHASVYPCVQARAPPWWPLALPPHFMRTSRRRLPRLISYQSLPPLALVASSPLRLHPLPLEGSRRPHPHPSRMQVRCVALMMRGCCDVL